MLNNFRKLHVGIKNADAVLESLRLEVQLLSHSEHPVNPVAAVYNIEGSRRVDAPISLQSTKAS